jgi:hypothetical protein
MLCLAFACLSLQRTRCLQELICHNEKIRSVHLAALIDIYAGLGNVIAVKARRSTHGGISGVVESRVLGARLFRRRWNLVLPEYGVENNDDDDLGVE